MSEMTSDRWGRRRSIRGAVAVVSVLLLVMAGCGDDDDSGDEAQESPTRTPDAAADLTGVCPNPIVVQASWWPAITEGELYSLLGPDPDIDQDQKSVTAPLVAHGKDTGVDLEVRSGGPAIGFTQTSAQMYLDPDITLGRIAGFDEVIKLSSSQPTLAVAAPLEVDPQMIFWDPETYPDVTTIEDIGEAGTTVVYVEGDTYMEYLVGSGILDRSQLDGGYDIARFVAEGGSVAESGLATHGPYLYENILEEWGKPIDYQLVYDTGYPNYGGSVVIRPDDKDELAPCLSKLVPMIQQAEVDVMADPDDTIALIARLSEEYDSDTPATEGSETEAARQMLELDLVGNGEDATAGNFDEARVQRMIDITAPIFAAQGQTVPEGLAPSDVMTNEFIDPDIGFEGG